MNYNFDYVGANKKTYAFSNATVGDRVWSLLHGWGTVDDVDRYAEPEDVVALHVRFDIGEACWYNLEGRYSLGDLSPELYWGKVKIISPEEPDTLIDFIKRNLDYIGNDEFGIGFNLLYEELGEDREPRWELLSSYDNEKMMGSLAFLVKPTADGSYLEIEQRLNLAKVTYEQMFDALKALGWI